jgi:hypothetical protein
MPVRMYWVGWKVGLTVTDFVYSVLIAIGIIIIALGVVAWMSLRGKNG